jgi:hypothetical protein
MTAPLSTAPALSQSKGPRSALLLKTDTLGDLLLFAPALGQQQGAMDQRLTVLSVDQPQQPGFSHVDVDLFALTMMDEAFPSLAKTSRPANRHPIGGPITAPFTALWIDETLDPPDRRPIVFWPIPSQPLEPFGHQPVFSQACVSVSNSRSRSSSSSKMASRRSPRFIA